MKWPRGKYNGRQIVGFSVKLRVRCDWWFWLPRFSRFPNAIMWLIFWLNFEPEYGYERKESEI